MTRVVIQGRMSIRRLTLALLLTLVGVGQVLSAPHANVRRLVASVAHHDPSVPAAKAGHAPAPKTQPGDEHRAPVALPAIVRLAPPPSSVVAIARPLGLGGARPVPILSFAPKLSPPVRSVAL